MSKSDTKKEMREQEIALAVLLKFIKPFDGSRDKLNAFINNCDNAISLTSSIQEDIVFKYILSQLTDKAESACSIKDFDSWSSLKEFLKNHFGERKHYAHLLTNLQECRQQNNESVNQFSLRIETCLSKLLTEVTISNSKKSELQGRLASMEDLALHAFTLGLHPRLSNIVRCRDPRNLNDAINHAISEEKIQQFSYRNNFNGVKAKTVDSSAVKNPNRLPSRPTYSNNINQPSSSRGPIICKYCKKVGHVLENCKLRDYNNKRFSSGSQPFNPLTTSTSILKQKQGVAFVEEDRDEEERDEESSSDSSLNE